MTITTQGIVRERSIELERDLDLPLGSRVRLVVESEEPMSADDFRCRVAATSGCSKDDPEFLAMMDEIVAERRTRMPREVKWDDETAP